MAFDIDYDRKTVRALVAPKFAQEVATIENLIDTYRADEALDCADAIVKKGGCTNDTALAYYLAGIYLEEEQDKKAEEITKKIYALYPDDIFANCAHARILLLHQEYDKMRNGFDQLFKSLMAKGVKEVALAEIMENLFLVGLSYLFEDDKRFGQAYMMLLDIDEDHERTIELSKIITFKYVASLVAEDECCGSCDIDNLFKDEDECCDSCEDEDLEEKREKGRSKSPSKKPAPQKK